MAMITGSLRGFEVAMQDPGICVITMNEPDRLNGMTRNLKRDMTEVLVQAQMEDEVRVVVITGTGRAFSAGDDITGRQPAYDDSQKLVPDIARGHHNPMGTYAALRSISQALNLAVRGLDKLSIAAINGVAIQTGMSLALSCDFGSPRRRRGSAAGRCGSPYNRTRVATTSSFNLSASAGRWTSS